ncbi:MAG TPA: PQQ-dependent sugar dehydrogenase, partial [Chitinophagales bacterium]|nr:PQQ-dependent sugar dehydrogenase [Chitinophagales bacterium]
YAGIGAPCNICEADSIFATIVRMNTDGSDFEIYAHGIRNTVGFDWHPLTGELWFSDNGRDGMGDELPPDELNHAPLQGMHFGFPYCHGGTTPDPQFGILHDCTEFAEPVQNLPAHVAALGIRFYTGTMFPAEYRNQIFIAEHGSWDRSTKIGYRVSLVRLQGTQSVGYEVFADGFEQDAIVKGRPVDLLVLPDGSMLLSDDYGDMIYRIYYE